MSLSMPFTIQSEDSRELPMELEIARDMCRLSWIESPTLPHPETVWEPYDGVLSARIYDNAHEEPIVSVTFGPTGAVTDVLVRRAPDYTFTIEEIPAALP